MNLAILIFQSGGIFTFFYGLGYSVQNLGLANMNYNGIYLGVTQAIGPMLVTPFAHKMKRRKWSIILQCGSLSAVALLAILSKNYEDTPLIRLIKSSLSAGVISVVISAQYPIVCSSMSEMFPSRLRGLSSALILFLSKVIAAFAPYFCSFAKNRGYHVMVGCSVITLVALILSLFQTETLRDENHEVDIGCYLDIGDGESSSESELEEITMSVF